MHECFHALRAYDYFVTKAELMRRHRDLLKPEIIWNIERGARLTLEELERAENQRVVLSARMLAFFQTYDLLLTPATIVAPFPVEQRYPTECDGVTFGDSFENYLDWLAIAYAITMTCCPALSLPCGFTSEGLPVGLQIAGAPRSEARILAAAKVMEDILGVRGSTPIDPK
jgi:amidase